MRARCKGAHSQQRVSPSNAETLINFYFDQIRSISHAPKKWGRSAPEHGPSAQSTQQRTLSAEGPLFSPHPLRSIDFTRFTFVPPRDQFATSICFSRSHFIVLHFIITLWTIKRPQWGPQFNESNSGTSLLCCVNSAPLVVFVARRSRSLLCATRSSRTTYLSFKLLLSSSRT